MRFGCRLSFFQLTGIHVFASSFHLMLYLSCDYGGAFRFLLEMLHPWANLLGHVARGQGNSIGRRGKELGIDQAFGGTWSTACV